MKGYLSCLGMVIEGFLEEVTSELSLQNEEVSKEKQAGDHSKQCGYQQQKQSEEHSMHGELCLARTKLKSRSGGYRQSGILQDGLVFDLHMMGRHQRVSMRTEILMDRGASW